MTSFWSTLRLVLVLALVGASQETPVWPDFVLTHIYQKGTRKVFSLAVEGYGPGGYHDARLLPRDGGQVVDGVLGFDFVAAPPDVPSAEDAPPSRLRAAHVMDLDPERLVWLEIHGCRDRDGAVRPIRLKLTTRFDLCASFR